MKNTLHKTTIYVFQKHIQIEIRTLRGLFTGDKDWDIE